MRRKTLLALVAALCAMAFSAVAASGASAAETTAYTCREVTPPGSGVFTNAHCSSTSGTPKNWVHAVIPAGETTQLTTKSISNPILTSTIALATVTLEGTGVECVGCHFSNSGTVGAMKASGEGGTLKFTGVIVKNLETKCEVHPVGNAAAVGVVETKPLKAETIATNEVKIEPVTPPVLAEFEITAKTGQKCNLAGKYEVTGSVTGTTSGATASFNVTLASGALKLSGEPASLTGELTQEGGLTGAEHHPIAFT